MLELLLSREHWLRMARNRALVAWGAGILSLGGLTIAFYSCCEPPIAGARSSQWNYPRAVRGAVVDDYFGTKVADPYRWMEALDAPDTKAWEIAETRLLSQFLGRLPKRALYRNRIANLWSFPSFGPLWREGGQYFFTKNDGTQDQDVLYVQARPEAAPRVLLDPNTLSSDSTVALTATAASPDGRWLAYGTSVGGSSWKQVHVLAVATGQVCADLVPWVRYSRLSWTRDSAGFFYSCYPESPAAFGGDKESHPIANHRIYYHRVGATQSDDRLIYRPEQPGWMMDAAVTGDGRYVVIDIATQVAGNNLVRFVELGDPAAPDLGSPVRPLIDAWNAQYSVIGNDGPTFYVQTNLDAPRGRIVAIDTRAPAPANWKTVVPESPDAIQSSSIVGGRLVVLAMHNVTSRLRVYERDGTPLPEVALPSLMGAVGSISGHPDDPELLFSFTTFTSPTTNYMLDLATREGRAFDQPKVGFNASAFETTQVFYPSKDGTRVPMFLTRKKGLKLDGTAPTLLYGYGGFDVSLTPSCYVPMITWIEMGGVYAVANLRGGGEFGEGWHQAGMRRNKQNVFDDFIAAAQWLCANGYTSPAHLVVRGRSNGGLLIGAVLNQRPDLCRVAFPEVGVMDMLRFQKFPNGKSWVSDYGSSDDRDGFETLIAYSPLHTIRTGVRYPAVCVIAADSDDKVNPAHSFKYTAALQAAVDDGPWALPAFIRIETQAGHGRGLARSKVIDMEADKLAFAAYFLGL